MLEENKPLEQEQYKPKTLMYLDNLGSENAGVSLLKEATQNPDVSNIGVLGTYGSGKSSIIRSYLKVSKVKNKKSIFFSIDTFLKYYKNNPENWVKIALYNELIKSSIDSIDFSQYLYRLENKKKRTLLTHFLHTLILILSFLLFFAIFPFVGWIISILSSLGFLFILFLVTECFVISKIKVGHNQVNYFEAENKSKLNIEKALDGNPVAMETIILDIIKRKNIEYFIIEDIDRIAELKETNGGNEKACDIVKTILSEFKKLSDLIKRHQDRVVFIYALSDCYFDNSEIRTKFFDVVVPVVSVSNTSNAASIIETDKFVMTKFSGIDKTVIYDLGPYFDNQRQINALLSQFYLFAKESCGKDRTVELFALCALNVLYPDFFFRISQRINPLSNLFNEISNSNSDVPNYIKINDVPNDIKKFYTDKEDFYLFIKTCLLNKYITSNYILLLTRNVNGYLSNVDNNFRMRCRAGEDVLAEKINDPKTLLINDKDNTLISNKNSLNIFIIHYILEHGSKAQKAKLLEVFNTIESGDECNKLIVEYFHQFKDDPKALTNFSKFVYKIPAFLVTIDSLQDVKISYAFYISTVIDKITFNQSQVKNHPFLDCLNSEDFQKHYAGKYNLESIKNILEFDKFEIVNIDYLGNNKDLIKKVYESRKFVFSYENIKKSNADFVSKPLTCLLKDSDILSSLIEQKTLFGVFDKIDITKNDDSNQDFIKIIKQIPITDLRENRSNQIFNGFKQKVHISEAKAELTPEKISILLDNRVLTVDDDVYTYFLEISKLDIFQNYLLSNFKFLTENNVVLGNTVLGKLILKFSSDDFIKIIVLFDCDKFDEYKTTYDTNSVLAVLENKKNKIDYFEKLQKENALVSNKALERKIISPADLKDIKLTVASIKFIIESGLTEYYIALGTEKNCKETLNFLKTNSIDNEKLVSIYLIDSKLISSFLDIDLILYLCLCDNIPFDLKALLIENCPDNILSSEKWIEFLRKYKNDEKKNFLYILNNDNNKRILNKFNDKCISISGDRKSDNTIKVKFFN